MRKTITEWNSYGQNFPQYEPNFDAHLESIKEDIKLLREILGNNPYLGYLDRPKFISQNNHAKED